jgi:hypothetical protein
MSTSSDFLTSAFLSPFANAGLVFSYLSGLCSCFSTFSVFGGFSTFSVFGGFSTFSVFGGFSTFTIFSFFSMFYVLSSF